MNPHASAEEVLDFWFGTGWDQLPAHQVAERQKKLWWSKNPDIDAQCRTRFEPLVQQAAANQLDDWTESPRSMLALILLLDQMPRNIYRDTRKPSPSMNWRASAATWRWPWDWMRHCRRWPGYSSTCRSNTPKTWTTRTTWCNSCAAWPSRPAARTSRPSMIMPTMRGGTMP
jgi:hypothetical protein